jgi:hypothetical protein
VQEDKKKGKFYVSLRFILTQHSRDSALIQSFINYLGCGRTHITSTSGRNEINFIVSVYSDIESKILPFFTNYPLIGNKKADFWDFLKVYELISSKQHLTEKGLDEINKIKNNMNSRRIDTSTDEPL